MKRFIYLGLLLSLMACKKDVPEETEKIKIDDGGLIAVPACIQDKIDFILTQEPYSPAAEVWSWYNDTSLYYYITSDCCDQFNYLYSENCDTICAPDGGFSGEGSGDCPEFTNTLEKTLVWSDDRE